MQNEDALALFAKQITLDQNSKPALTQALRIAMYNQYKVYELYRLSSATFQKQEPFTNIMQAKTEQFDKMVRIATNLQIEAPVNDITGSIKAPNSLKEAYELAVAAEVETIQMYDYLIPYVAQNAELLDAFYQFQAASYNKHLPVFRSHVQNADQPTEVITQKVNEFIEQANKVVSGEATSSDIQSLLSQANLSLVGGLLAGGIGGVTLNQFFSKEDQKS